MRAEKMLEVAITGGFGTGKTTVAGLFQTLGAKVVDVDAITHQLQEHGAIGWKKIHQAFGKSILNQDRSLNRKALADLVFSNPKELKKLNEIIHPLVIAEMHKQIAYIQRQDIFDLLVVDIPLLFEVKAEKEFDAVIVVKASENVVQERIGEKRAMSKNEIAQRIRSQQPLEKKEANADFVIDNNRDPKKTTEQVHRIHSVLMSGAFPAKNKKKGF